MPRARTPWLCVGTVGHDCGTVLLPGPSHSQHRWPGVCGAQSGSPDAQYLVGPLQAAPASRHGLFCGLWAVSKCFLFHLTCAQRTHGSQQQQAALAALRAQAQTFPNTDTMKPEHEAPWFRRVSDLRSVGMFREAADRTHLLRSRAVSEARKGNDDWVREHAAKGSKRLHASTTDPAQILAFKRQFWSEFWGAETRCHKQLTSVSSPFTGGEGRGPSTHHHDRPCSTQPFEPRDDVQTSIMLKPKPDSSDRPLGVLPMTGSHLGRSRPVSQCRLGAENDVARGSVARLSATPWRWQQQNAGWTQHSPWSTSRNSTTRSGSITW